MKKEEQLDLISEPKPKKVSLIKMVHMDTKKRADVHPIEQLNYFKGGYRKLKNQQVIVCPFDIKILRVLAITTQ